MIIMTRCGFEAERLCRYGRYSCCCETSFFQSVNSNVPNPRRDFNILNFSKVLTRTSASIDGVERVGSMSESSERVERNTNRTRRTGTCHNAEQELLMCDST